MPMVTTASPLVGESRTVCLGGATRHGPGVAYAQPG